MFLHPPPPTPASARLQEGDVATLGYVMNLTRAWAWRPDVSEAFAALRRALTGSSTLTPREVAVIVCATAAARGDSYCALAWGSRLAADADPTTAAAVLTAAGSDSLSDRERALVSWVRKLVADPNATTASDVAALRAAGLADGEIFEATVLAAFRLAFSTVNDALGVTPDAQLVRAAPEAVRQAVHFGRACTNERAPQVDPSQRTNTTP